MRPRTREEMDTIVRTLVRDCLDLAQKANLRQVNLASLLGTTRLTVSKWHKHWSEGGELQDYPVTGATAAQTFMNLLITRRLLELGLASGDLPVDTEASARRWVRSVMDPAR